MGSTAQLARADALRRRRERWSGESGVRWANLVLTATLVAAAAVMIWGSDRGFDFSDEGVYFLAYRHPDQFVEPYTYYPRFGAAVFAALGYSISAVRVVTFAGLVLATLVFWWGFLSFLRSTGLNPFRTPLRRTNGLLLTLLSVLPAFCWPPPSLSYNSMAGMALLVAAGCLLRALVPARTPGQVLRSLLALFGFGVGVMFLLMVKGSAAIALAASGVVLVLLLTPVPFVQRLWLLGALALATLLAGAVFFVTVKEFAATLVFLGDAWRGLLLEGAAGGLVERHAREFLELLRRTAVSYNFPLALAAAALVFALVARGRYDLRDRWSRIALVAFLAIFAASGFGKNGFLAGISHRNGTMLFYSALAFSLFLLGAASHILRDLPRGTVRVSDHAGYTVFVAWLALLPFCGAVGTTHRVYVNTLLHLAPLFALYALLAADMDRRMRAQTATLGVSCLLCVFAFSQFVHGYVKEPYRLPEPLAAQRLPTELGEPPTTLKLDARSSAFVRRLREVLHGAGFQPGGDIVALFDMPGVVFAAGGVSPGRIWYFGGYEQEEGVNIELLRRAGRERLRRAFVLQSDNDARVEPYFASAGIRFPDEYVYLAELTHPEKGWRIQVWAPRERGPLPLPDQNE